MVVGWTPRRTTNTSSVVFVVAQVVVLPSAGNEAKFLLHGLPNAVIVSHALAGPKPEVR